jgi:hypothetical protein
MNIKVKWAFAAFLVVLSIYLIPAFSSADTKGTVYYIKNNYTQGAYLYEEEGILRYGIPAEGDERFQWIIEEDASYKTIKNAATNDYITLEGHGDATVEGSWGENIACRAMEDGKDTYLWEFELGKAQNILSAGKAYEGFALHLENATAGQPFAQKLSGDQLAWGNMLWNFVQENEVDFASLLGNGFCIQNAEDGTYLRVDNGVLTHGTPDGADEAYIWVIEPLADGTKALRNKKTSQYLTMSTYDASSLTLGLKDYAKGDLSFSWDIMISKAVTISSADPAYQGYGLMLEAGSNKKVKCKEILSSGKEIKAGMRWNMIPSSEVAEVTGDLVLADGIYNLKNSYYSLYLIEDDGKAVYGNAQPSDQNAQWQILYDKASGLTALKNVATGDYLYGEGETGKLVFTSTATYYWKMKGHKNADYPKAVIFQDSVNTTSYLHMESLNGFTEDSGAVQPTWGTPHWEPVLYEESAAQVPSGEAVKVPEDYIRMYCSAREGEYLYENSSGAVTYKQCEDYDARSHWKLLAGEAEGTYYIKNRETGDYIINMGNGILRCVPEEQAKAQESLWEVSGGGEDNTLLLNNYDTQLEPYQRPLLNIQKLSGLAQSTLVSKDEETSRWIYEVASDASAAAENNEEEQVPLSTFTDTNLYQLLLEGEALESLYRLEYCGNNVRILDIKKNKTDAKLQWQMISGAGETYLKNGDTKLVIKKVPSDAFYDGKTAYVSGDSISFTVYTEQSDIYQVKLTYQGKKVPVTVLVNGITQADVILPAGSELKLKLNKGINTITVEGSTAIDSITVCDSLNINYRGASLSYTQYQAEDCNTTGTVLNENRAYHEITSEAAGRLAVSLEGTGQYIKLTLTEPANSLVLRYCIPDSEDGTGMDASLNLYIDGRKYQSMELTSRYSWVYGAYPWTNTPADGQAHHFFDEINIRLDQTYPAGTVIKLQKDAANYAEYYIVDEIDAEEIAESGSQPENSLSIADFGAVPGDGQDDSEAFYYCMAEAVKQGKEVWIPEGVFDINHPTSDYDAGDKEDKNRGILITQDNVVIRGAGMWYSILQGDYAAFFIKASNISLYDFSLRGTAAARRDSIDPSAIETDYNTPDMKKLTIQNVWIEHYKTGIWTHNMDGLQVIGCRIRNTFADGMNLRKGTSNAVVEQCDIRNTGDDAIALWSSEASDINIKIRFNKVGLQWLANNIAVYGGTDIEITDNLLYDTIVNGAGINISSNFDPQPFAGTVTVARNTLLRCGSEDSNNNQEDGAIWFNTVQGNDNNAKVVIEDNLILNSTYQGISFSNRGSVSDVTLEGNVILESGTYGIEILKAAKGSAYAKNNLIKDMMLEAVNNGSPKSFALSVEIIQEAAKDEQGESDGTVLLAAAVLAAFIAALVIFCYLWRRKRTR